MVHPKADIPVEFFDAQADYRRYVSDSLRKGKATIGSLPGVIVKSLQEQKIANWLWQHSVSFAYERQIAVEDDDGTVRHLHPDFYYPQTETVHEDFALNADGTSPFADYALHAEKKRQAYRRKEIDFFETTSAQASNETLLSTLESELAQRSMPFRAQDLRRNHQGTRPRRDQALPPADIHLPEVYRVLHGSWKFQQHPTKTVTCFA